MNYKIDHCDPFLGDRSNIWMKLEHCGRYLFACDYLVSHGARNVLDAACAEGYGLQLMEESGLITYGADINAEYVKTAGTRSGAKLAVVDFDNDDWPEQYHDLDAVVCFETIEHVHKPERLIRNISASLRDSGMLLLSVPSDRYEKTDANGINYDPFHVNIFSRKDVTGMLEASGLQIREIYGQALCNELYVYEKKAIERGALDAGEADSFFRYDRNTIIKLSHLLAYPEKQRIEESYAHIYIAVKEPE